MKKETKKLVKVISAWTTFAVVSLGLVTGVVFGAKNSWQQGYDTDITFDNQYQIEVEVVRESTSNDSIYTIAQDAQVRLDYAGYDQAEIYIVDDNHLMLSVNMESINQADPYSYETQAETIDELVAIYASVFLKFNIEFRTTDGQQMFDVVNGQVQFVTPQYESTETASTTTYEDVETTEDILLPPDVEIYQIQLVADNSAEIVYQSGYPYVKFTPYGDLWVEFDKAVDYLSTADTSTNATANQYVVWMGFDALMYLIELTDPEGWAAAGGTEANVLTYCYTDSTGAATTEPIDLCDPFLIGAGTATQPLSTFDKTITLNLGLTLDQTKEAVARINFSTQDYSFKLQSTTLIETSQSEMSLLIVIIALMTVIILVAFSFTWYFGLLGFLASLVIGSIGAMMMASLAAFMIPITAPVLFGILISALVLVVVSGSILKALKECLMDNMTFGAYIKKAFGDSWIKTFPVVITTIVLLIGLTTLTPIAIKVGLSFAIYSILIGFLSLIFGFTLIAFGFIWLFDKQTFEHFKKKETQTYSFWIGKLGKSESKQELLNVYGRAIKHTTTNKMAKITAFAAVALVILSFGLFGILWASTGSGMNTSGSYDTFYRYDVVLNSNDWIDTNDLKWTSDIDYNDPYNEEQLRLNVIEDTNAIIDAFEDNGVNVNSTFVIRQDSRYVSYITVPDNPTTPQQTNEYQFSYGLAIYSNEEMTQAQFDAINTDLAALDNDGDITTDDSGYTISLNQSLSSSTVDSNTGAIVSYNASSMENFTQPFEAQKMLYSMLIAAALLFSISWILYKWSFAVSLVGTVVGELLVLWGLLTVLYIPVTPFIFAAMAIVMFTSVFLKTLLNNNIKQQMSKTKEKNKHTIQNGVVNGMKNTLWRSLIIVAFMLAITSAILSVFGASTLIIFISMLFGSLIILFANNTIYPWLLVNVETLRIRLKQQQLTADMNRAKDVDSLEEEYIEGINYDKVS